MRELTIYQGDTQQLTISDVRGFIDSVAALKDTSKARTIATIKSCLSFALKTEYLQMNVGSVVKLPKIKNRIAERIMSVQAVARMLALESHPRNYAMLALLYRAGLRAQEVCDLQWRHLQPREQSGQLAIYGKGKKMRYILLDSTTWQELEQLCPRVFSPYTYVFQSRQARSRTNEDTQRRMDESMIHVIVARAAKRAKIEGKVSPHWMRHAHATHSLENGAPITLVRDTLGHSSMETTAKLLMCGRTRLVGIS